MDGENFMENPIKIDDLGGNKNPIFGNFHTDSEVEFTGRHPGLLCR